MNHETCRRYRSTGTQKLNLSQDIKVEALAVMLGEPWLTWAVNVIFGKSRSAAIFSKEYPASLPGEGIGNEDLG